MGNCCISLPRFGVLVGVFGFHCQVAGFHTLDVFRVQTFESQAGNGAEASFCSRKWVASCSLSDRPVSCGSSVAWKAQKKAHAEADAPVMAKDHSASCAFSKPAKSTWYWRTWLAAQSPVESVNVRTCCLARLCLIQNCSVNSSGLPVLVESLVLCASPEFMPSPDRS